MENNSLAENWLLDPEVIFLNHGSFGATPTVVLDEQERTRRRIETEPLLFFDHHYLEELDLARKALGAFIGARTQDLAFVVGSNANKRPPRAGAWWHPRNQPC